MDFHDGFSWNILGDLSLWTRNSSFIWGGLNEWMDEWIHAEAEYAFNMQKRIVALRLEPGYKPDGWLGPLCRNNLFYDFSAPEKFDDEWSRLHTKLKEMKQPGFK